MLQFVKDQPFLLYGARDNNTIAATAIHCETQKYLKETDINKKRYFACHCQFARKSILQKEEPVLDTLCNCSLGHTKIFWEAVLDTPLDGEAVSSVLGDGLLCGFLISLCFRIIKGEAPSDVGSVVIAGTRGSNSYIVKCIHGSTKIRTTMNTCRVWTHYPFT